MTCCFPAHVDRHAESNFVRFFRFVGLVATVLVAYSAFLWLNPTTLTALPSAGPFAFLATLAPLLHEFTRYTPLAIGLASVTFGVLTAPWPLPRRLPLAEHSQTAARPTTHWAGWLLLLLAVAITSGALTLRWQRGHEELIIHTLWAVGILVYLLACSWLGDAPRVNPPKAQQTEGHWPAVLLILLAALFYGSWQLTTLPLQVDDASVNAGSQALTLAVAPAPPLFISQTAEAPAAALVTPTTFSATLALAPTALLVWLAGDLLLGMRLLGLGSLLLFGLSVWLVSRELFRRAARSLPEVTFMDGLGVISHPQEDDGSTPALLAMVFALTSSLPLLLSRHPFLLAALAVGMLGCWALLRAWGTFDRLALGLSGVLFGFAVIWHFSNWSLLGVALVWWLGVAVANQGWLPHRARWTAAVRAGNRGQHPFRFADFLLWLIGIVVVIALFGFALLPLRSAFGALFTPHVTQQVTLLVRAVIGLDASPALPTLLATGGALLLHRWLIPLLVLAIGSLCFNLDRKQGWMILSWIAVTLLWAGAVAAEHSEVAMLLPLAPPLAVALAFALDRLRVTLLRAGGGWLSQFWSYGVLGLLLWIAFQNGLTHYTTALHQVDSISALGQLLRQYTGDEIVVVIDPDQHLQTAAAIAQLQVLTAGADKAFDTVAIHADVPTDLQAGTTVILLGNEAWVAPAIRAQYPQATQTVQRAINANPLLYIYELR